jgi:hypothetical protein
MSGVGPPGGYGPPTSSVQQLRRSSLATVTVADVRHSDLVTFSDRLSRVGQFAWASVWVTVATLAGGAFLGGAIGLIPFLSTSPPPSHHARFLYVAALIVVALLTAVMGLAALTTHRARAESIADIKTDFDKMLASFEMPPRIRDVVKATYGLPNAPNRQADVTPTVAGHLKDGKLDFIVGLGSMGCDPAEGDGKWLDMQYRLTGSDEILQVRCGEGQRLRVPDS